MQKLITIAIDIEELKEHSSGAFTITEVEGVNTLLQEGWIIQEWEFLTNETETEEEKAIVLLILSEELTEEEFEESADSDTEDPEDAEEDEAFEENETASEEQGDEQHEIRRTAAQTDMSLN